MALIAHAGHWLTSVAYFVPVVGFLAWLAWCRSASAAAAAARPVVRTSG